jgi:hypothetical protein
MKNIIILFILFFFAGCKNDKKSNTLNNAPSELKEKTDSNVPLETVKSFLHWYKANENKLYQFNTIDGGDGTNYSVNFGEVKKEIDFLNKSNLFSRRFIDNYENRYKEGDLYFKEHPQNDGPPYGFDYDFFFMTQDDYDTDLQNIDKIAFALNRQNDTLCYVVFHLKNCGMTYKYTLKKNQIWQIDNIENVTGKE